MKPRLLNGQKSLSLDQLAHDIYESLARRFPICLGSDEFHFFPHYRSMNHDWSVWDDFSPESVSEVITQASQWESQLSALSLDSLNGVNAGASSLARLLATLREQLEWVCFQESQPTFYLTIVGVGLVEALDAGPKAYANRIAGLPDFLNQAITNLNQLSHLYWKLGLEMTGKICEWLTAISQQPVNCQDAVEVIRKFMNSLKTLDQKADFLLSPELYEHIVKYHINCRASLAEVEDHLVAEIEETNSLMTKVARELCPGTLWQKVLAELPSPTEAHTDPSTVYGEVIEDLYRHCNGQKFLTADVNVGPQVNIREIPDCMRSVRSDAAFSMPPGHPPGIGIFYILPANDGRGVPADYRFLSAHETYPGHKLLDSSRWLLSNVAQRSIEFPIFYEGWASFSEEILFDTGFFSGAVDQLLMAKRRYWRAQRGLIDLRIHSGRWDLPRAVRELMGKGLSLAVSRDMVHRYALKPGYQLAYTMGRRYFEHLYNRYRERGGTIGGFVRSVLAAGEIRFDNLAQLLNLKELDH